jgi:hypothetical protein
MNSSEGIYIRSDLGSGLVPVFYVTTEGRLKATVLDIAGDGTFAGKLVSAGGIFVGTVDIINGKTNVKIAEEGDNPFWISYDGVPIFSIDNLGNGAYSGKVIASAIEGSTFKRRGIINGEEMDICSIDEHGFVYLPTDTMPFQIGLQIMPGYIRSTWTELQLGPTGLGITIKNDGVYVANNRIASTYDISEAIADHVAQYHSNP